MIIFTSHDNCYTLNRFFKNRGRSLRNKIKIIFYADLPYYKSFPEDIYLFTDLERLDNVQIELAVAAQELLQAAGTAILNAPSQALRRYELLEALYKNGTNQFRAYRLHEDRTQFRYPVFLRFEREHQGSLSPLLHNAQEVEQAVEKARHAGLPDDNLLLVEYCDVRDPDGLYRKYSAYRLGDSFLPSQLYGGSHWISKSTGNEVNEHYARIEQKFLEEFPHETEIRGIFQDAGIEYGRIDYSLLNGKIQVWEINTNPNIIPENEVVPLRRAGQDRVHQNICDAFGRLITNAPQQPSKRIPFHVSPPLKQKLGINDMDHVLHPLRRQLRPIRPERVKRFVKKQVLRLR